MLSKVIFKGSVVCNSQGREEIIFLRLGPTGPRPNDICQGVLSMPGYHLKQKKEWLYNLNILSIDTKSEQTRFRWDNFRSCFRIGSIPEI